MIELELVRRAKAGDNAALSELLAGHSTRAYRVALHVLRNQADAEDAIQNAFVKAFSNLARFDERRPFAPWLLRIVVREALNLGRAERTRFAFWQRQYEHPQRLEVEETAESIALDRVEQQDLLRAVNQLRTNDRLVITLSYFMGMSEADVAVTLGVRRGTVKKRKHDALVRLRALVQREFPGLQPLVAERLESGGATS